MRLVRTPVAFAQAPDAPRTGTLSLATRLCSRIDPRNFLNSADLPRLELRNQQSSLLRIAQVGAQQLTSYAAMYSEQQSSSGTAAASMVPAVGPAPAVMSAPRCRSDLPATSGRPHSLTCLRSVHTCSTNHRTWLAPRFAVDCAPVPQSAPSFQVPFHRP